MVLYTKNMKNLIKTLAAKVVLNKAKLIGYAIIVVMAVTAVFSVKSFIAEYNKVKAELMMTAANVTSYQDQLDAAVKDKAVLELTVASLEHFNDSIVQEMVKTKKRLKIALNKPGDVAAHIGTSFETNDTIYLPIPIECAFDTVIKPDSLTEFSIKYKNNQLIHHSKINNNQDLFVYSNREYVNEYKSGWCRFWHFDFKKRDITRYVIENDNKNIKTINTRVFKVN